MSVHYSKKLTCVMSVKLTMTALVVLILTWLFVTLV